MPKVRVIPTILTDGTSQVKGTGFDSWRTVGSVVQAIKLYASRDVDELVLLDVVARSNGSRLSEALVAQMSRYLRIPFSVGGGVDTMEDIERLLRAGADKVVLGTSAFECDGLIEEAAKKFGSQALIGAIDIADESGNFIAVESGKRIRSFDLSEAVEQLQSRGIGEILLQSVARDGCRLGMDVENIRKVSGVATVPIIASSGAGSYAHLEAALSAGAEAVAAGAMFQFSELTPAGAREHLRNNGYNVRR